MKANKNIPVNKNDNITLKIEAYTSEGYGIGRYEGFAVFVPFALVGETVNVHIIKVSKGFAVGKLTELIEKNDDIRETPCCFEFLSCGGCDIQHMKYEKQLEFKRDRVYNALKRIGGIDIAPEAVLPTVGMNNPVHYRNKASFPFGNVDGRTRLGFYAPRSHRLIPIEDCPIQEENTVIAMRVVEEWANKYDIPAYDEESGSGILRHLVVRSSKSGISVCVVTCGNALPYKAELTSMLKEELPGLSGVIHNINDRVTNVILGEKYKTVYGTDTLTEELCGLEFNVRTPSFLQVNREQTVKLYEAATEYLAPKKSETIFDIYCGIGTISLLVAKSARKVYGIESVKEAVEDAKSNAVLNNLDNTEFIAGEAEKVLPQLVKAGTKADAVIIDPPRKGCEEVVLRAIIESGVERLVYVSCNPETLARDVKILSEGGFALSKAQPVDMFPQCAHVETVCLLSRKVPV